jgi:hypothetical protein
MDPMTTPRLRHLRLAPLLAVLGCAIAPAAAPAAGTGPLLGGYGSPGAGEQVVLGDELLPPGGGGGGGDGFVVPAAAGAAPDAEHEPAGPTSGPREADAQDAPGAAAPAGRGGGEPAPGGEPAARGGSAGETDVATSPTPALRPQGSPGALLSGAELLVLAVVAAGLTALLATLRRASAAPRT